MGRGVGEWGVGVTKRQRLLGEYSDGKMTYRCRAGGPVLHDDDGDDGGAGHAPV